MADQKTRKISITIIFFLIIDISASAKQKDSHANPVHEVFEVINEQARIDEHPTHANVGNIPYGNPLAGNNKQNLRLHAHNQQAMFNAERIRQHKAQLQRWMKAPQLEDSYMKAYHESQESHQLALEQQQATLIDAPVTNAPKRRGNFRHRQEQQQTTLIEAPVTKAPRRRGSPKPRQETLKSGIHPIQSEPIRITKADAVKAQRARSHRSYGSVEYQQYLQPKKYKTIYVTPGPTYDQGVTIRPNGNVGFTHEQNEKPQHNLYTQAVTSDSKYVYPKQYSQMHNYHSQQDIEMLHSLLKKNPHEQLSEFNALLHTKENTEDDGKNDLNTPIDQYFYLKDPSVQTISQQSDSFNYAQAPNTYAAAYLNDINALRDHTPITEDIEDIEDPQQYRPKTYGLQSPVVTQAPDLGTTTTKSNNYYKVEVASQTISAGHNQNGIKDYFKENRRPYEALYGQQPTAFYAQDTKQNGDLSERYLHHNAQHKGVQHLSEDGVGVSAYGDENVSTQTYEFKVVTNISIALPSNKRNKRDVLETEPFLLANETLPLTETPILSSGNDTDDDPKSESLIRIPVVNKNRMSDFNLFVTTPNFPIGEAIDYNYNDYDEIPLKLNRPSNHKFQVAYEDEDYSNYNDEFSSPDYEVTNFKTPQLSSNTPIQNYAPSTNYPQSPDLKSSFSSKFGQFKRYPNFAAGLSQIYGVPQSYGLPSATTYGVPQGLVHSVYGTTQNFGPPVRYVNELPNIDNMLEPVYMLTQSQLQNLIGHHNLNIEHLDVYQLSKDKRPIHYPRKYRKRYPYRNRHIKKNLHKLHKLNVV